MKITNYFFVFLLGILIVSGCGGSTPADSSTTTDSATDKEVSEKPAEIWKYSEEVDEMSGTKQLFASTTSTNQLEFDFPYSGGTTFQLTVRNLGKESEVVLTLDKGQFMGSMGDDYCRVKFDEGEPEKFYYGSASDGSPDVIFFNSNSKFISKLKQSKKVMIEAPFFEAGRQVIYFETEGLKWE